MKFNFGANCVKISIRRSTTLTIRCRLWLQKLATFRPIAYNHFLREYRRHDFRDSVRMIDLPPFLSLVELVFGTLSHSKHKKWRHFGHFHNITVRSNLNVRAFTSINFHAVFSPNDNNFYAIEAQPFISINFKINGSALLRIKPFEHITTLLIMFSNFRSVLHTFPIFFFFLVAVFLLVLFGSHLCCVCCFIRFLWCAYCVDGWIRRCEELKLIERCHPIEPRPGTLQEILLKHTQEQYDTLAATSNETNNDKLEELSSNYDAIYIHPVSWTLFNCQFKFF